MTFDEAKTFVMPFGKYKGKTLDEIAKTDEGLLYLDWAVCVSRGLVLGALNAYLQDPVMEKEVRDAMGGA